MTIKLVYMSDNPFGGWVTFTSHLAKGLGKEVKLFKIRKRTERCERKFGYGLTYRNITAEDLAKIEGPTIITALHKNKLEFGVQLLDQGAWLVVHDPNEFYVLDHVQGNKVITIRETVHQQIPGSAKIGHPYKRNFPKGTVSKRTVHAVSVSRIDFDKNTDVILRANKQLPKDRQVQLHGFENRLYGKFKLAKEFPEWMEVQSTHQFERNERTASEICNQATYAVDLSLIKQDGGGTQYSFLEAMDAGAFQVIHAGWARRGDEMKVGTNCLAVGDHEELAKLLKGPRPKERVLKNAEVLLRKHDAIRIANKYLELIG